MIPFFRKIRKKLADDNQFLKYSRYAIGEIVLVVIGILIALQINNWNEDQKTRKKELIYLENIKTDLLLNIEELNNFIEARSSCVASCEKVIKYFDGEIELDLNDFNFHSLSIMIWFPFVQHDNAYQELLNSGNLAILSEKKIKNGLQNMQVGFKNIAFIEGEMQQDYESYLYDTYFSIADLNANLKEFESRQNYAASSDESKLSRQEILLVLKSMKFKNGVTLSKYNSELLIAKYQEMISNILKFTPKKLQVNGIDPIGNWDGENFTFRKVFPLLGKTTEFNYLIEYEKSKDSLTIDGDTINVFVNDTTHEVDFTVEVEPFVMPQDSFYVE